MKGCAAFDVGVYEFESHVPGFHLENSLVLQLTSNYRWALVKMDKICFAGSSLLSLSPYSVLSDMLRSVGAYPGAFREGVSTRSRLSRIGDCLRSDELRPPFSQFNGLFLQIFIRSPSFTLLKKDIYMTLHMLYMAAPPIVMAKCIPKS